MSATDLLQRFANKQYGPFRGTVVDVDDPRQLSRVKVHVPVVHGTDPVTGEKPHSGWAWPMFGGGSSGSGFLHTPSQGDTVWVQFEEGDVERPVWTHGAWTLKGGTNNLPAHGRDTYDASDNKMRGTDDVPESQLQNDYGEVTAIVTKYGHRLEFDSKRVVLEHKSGSRFEFLDDGTLHDITTGNKREVVVGSKGTIIGGKKSMKVKGTSEEIYGKRREIENNGGIQEITIGSAVYTYNAYARSSDKELIEVRGDSKRRVLGSEMSTVLGSRNESVLGSYEQFIGETAKWIMTNASSFPGVAGGMHVMNVTGDLEFKAGVDPLGVGMNSIRINNPVGMLPTQFAGIVLKATAMMALEAPVVVVSSVPVVGIPTVPIHEPVTRGISLLAVFNSHTHGGAAGPTTPPIPLMTNTVLSGGGTPTGLWTT